RYVGRVFGCGLQGREQFLQARGDAGVAAGKQGVELVDLAQVGHGIAVQRRTAAHLSIEELVVDAAHVSQGRARTDIAGTTELRRTRGLNRLLAGESGRVDVDDVVTGDSQRRLVRSKSGEADIE